MTQYRVTATSLNVRKGPSIKDAVIGWFKEGEVVEWISTSEDGYWLQVKKGKRQGWCSQKYLQPVVPPPAPARFPWMEIAAAEEGTKELPGNQQNSRILQYLHSTNLPAADSAKDETAWCSAFVNWCVERSGYEGTDSAWARSWLNWGKPLSRPVPGCIVVLSRGQGKGHVGFFVRQTKEEVAILGGNQSDKVCVDTYPKNRVLGYRAPGA